MVGKRTRRRLSLPRFVASLLSRLCRSRRRMAMEMAMVMANVVVGVSMLSIVVVVVEDVLFPLLVCS